MIKWPELFAAIEFENYYPLNGRRTKQCSDSFYNMECPFCGSSGQLLGISRSEGFVTCYFCSSHSAVETIKELGDLSWKQAFDLADKYKESAVDEIKHKATKAKGPKKRNKTLQLPAHTKLKVSGAEYLKKRGFSVKKMVEDFGVVQAKKGTEYTDRIIIPINYEGSLVSYITRDITGEKQNKYKVCPSDDELVDHKDILFNIDNCTEDWVIVVEGSLDCMKFEPSVVCSTLGIKYSQSQANALKKFSTVFVLFDSEPKARLQGKLLASGLSLGGVNAYNLQLSGGRDPGDCSYEEMSDLVEHLMSSIS
jgi:DNA primase